MAEGPVYISENSAETFKKSLEQTLLASHNTGSVWHSTATARRQI